MYHYAGNNPVKYIDPDGEIAKGAVAAAFAVDVLIPEPTDLIPLKWVAWGMVFVGIAALESSITKAIVNTLSQTKNAPKIEVFHSTNSPIFANRLVAEGNSVIDKSQSNPDSRFGKQFYVASDRVTAKKEASGTGVLVRFSMDPNARILDLSNPETAKKMGYTTGMSREDARNLMKQWDLTGVDAIRYPSEQNPGGYNYAVINPLILKPEGVEP